MTLLALELELEIERAGSTEPCLLGCIGVFLNAEAEAKYSAVGVRGDRMLDTVSEGRRSWTCDGAVRMVPPPMLPSAVDVVERV